MQPSRTRLICRAHNRFTPSIALWQHFVGPSRPPPQQQQQQQQRQSSSAAEPVQHGANNNTSTTSLIRRPTTAKGTFYANKVDASKAKNRAKTHYNRQATLTQADKLLAATRAAFDAAEDYTGVVVQSKVPEQSVKESALPWCAQSDEERKLNGMDRYVQLDARMC
jgi:non-canonical poly(A) RNA polymerase PAPD5/7